jgi:hypothetical protein
MKLTISLPVVAGCMLTVSDELDRFRLLALAGYPICLRKLLALLNECLACLTQS